MLVSGAERQINDTGILDTRFMQSDAAHQFVISHLLPNEVLQNRAFPSTLAADHCDLRKVQDGILSDGREGVLQPVYQRNQVIHSPIAHLVR